MKVKFFIILCFFILLIAFGCSAKENADYYLVFPTNINDTTKALMAYTVDQKPFVLYQYELEHLEYPSMYTDHLICKSKNSNNTANLIQFNDERSTLYELSNDMIYPQIESRNNIIFLEYQKDSFNLCSIGLDTNENKTILEDIVYGMPAIQDEVNILISKNDDGMDYIYLCDIEGNCEKLTLGNTPVWLNNEAAFIYVFDNRICKYDMQSNKSERLFEEEYNFGTGAAISPDNKYIAFYHGETLSWPYVAHILVISLEDGTIYRINYNGIQIEDGLCWVNYPEKN